MNKLFYTAATVVMLLSIGCKKEGCTAETAVNFDEDAKKDDGSCIYEYIADDETFANFMSWPNDVTNSGADPSLGGAHAGNDSTVTRHIYFKDGQDPVSGSYPDGTMIVKHTTNHDGTLDEYTAMVKRGNAFDADGGNWEYFMLNADGSIAVRGAGAEVLNGMCQGCHAGAGTDYIFSK